VRNKVDVIAFKLAFIFNTIVNMEITKTIKS